MTQEYSHKSLAEKLEIKKNYKILVLNAPKNYFKLLVDLPEDIVLRKILTKNLDFIHFFPKNKSDLEKSFPKVKKYLKLDGILWVSWRKGNTTDLNENKVMTIGLENGLVDIKVIAVDKTWSALKFVYRLKDRK